VNLSRPTPPAARIRRLPPFLLAGLAAVLAAAALAAPALAGSHGSPRARLDHYVQIGISDDNMATFSDPRFRWLGMHSARIVLAYNIMRRPLELYEANGWLQQARQHGVKPLVVFEKDPIHPGHLPGVSEYEKAVKAFMAFYPWITEYSAWNEENHYLQPTARNPRRAADYFNVLSRDCRHCTVTAADVLDITNMAAWTRDFLRWAHHPRVWGLHNYTDLSAGESWRTEEFLRIVPGQVWFTETGGVVWRYEHYNRSFVVHNESYAAEVAGHLISLANVSSRVTRIYYYQWRVSQTLSWARKHPHTLTWDSGLIRPDCSLRPAFGVLARAMGKNVTRVPRAHKNRAGVCV
jgi:hypothetical protein